MRQLRELFRNSTNTGEVDTLRGDYLAHRGARRAAQESGAPVNSWAQLVLPEIESGAGAEATAARLAPALARWIMERKLHTILSPEQLSRHPSHRTVGRAIMRAAMQAAIAGNMEISVLVGHGETAVQGTWAVGSALASTPTALEAAVDGSSRVLVSEQPGATSYSHHRICPGILASESVEAQFADQDI